MTEETTMSAQQLADFLELNRLCRMSRDEIEMVLWFRLLKEVGLGDKARALLQALTATAAFEGKRVSLIEATKEDETSPTKVSQNHKTLWDGAPLACWALESLKTALGKISLSDDEIKLPARKRIPKIQKKVTQKCETYLHDQFGIPTTYAHFLMRNCCEMPSGNAQYRSRATTIHCPVDVKSLTEPTLIIVPAKQIRARQMGKERGEKIEKKNAAKKGVAGKMQKVVPKKAVTQKSLVNEDFKL